MRKALKTFAAIALLLGPIAVMAQDQHQLRVTIPFSFVAGDTLAPAGDYRLEIDSTRNVVTFWSPDTSTSMLLLTMKGYPHNWRSYVRFRRYGGQWFLQEVATNGIVQDALVSKTEKAAQRNMIAQTTPAGQTVTVAGLTVH